jgi:hypothetical protein
MGDLTTIIMGISIVVLAWTIARINEKVDRQIKKFKRFEEALKKNATGRIKGEYSDSKNQTNSVLRQ